MTEKKLTFSGFKISFAQNQIKKSIKNKNYDDLSYWSAELHISKKSSQWWSNIILYCAQNITHSNPKIGKFLLKFKQDFPGVFKNDIDEQIRQGICFLNGVVLFSPKDLEIQIPKSTVIESEEYSILQDLDIKSIHPFVNLIRKPNDKHIVLALSSYLVEAIVDNNIQGAMKVIGLFLYFEKKKECKKAFVCHSRAWKGLKTKFYNRYELFLLDLLVSIAKKRNVSIHNRLLINNSEDKESTNETYEVLASWRALYILNTNFTTTAKNFSIILNCVHLLCSRNLRLDLPSIHNKNQIIRGMQLIDGLYHDIFKSVKC